MSTDLPGRATLGKRMISPSTRSFTLEDGLPVLHATELDAADVRAAILEYGSLIVRALVGPDHVARLIEVVDDAFATVTATDPTRAWLRTKGGVLTGDSPRAQVEVSDVFTAAGIGKLAEDYLGEPPILSLDKWTLRRGRAENGIEWHQDGAFLGEHVHALNVWLALSPCGIDAPSLDVIPRRIELVPVGTDGATYDWSVGEPMVNTVAPDGWSRPQFEAGDALLFDERLLHRTSPDLPGERYAIETWFFGPSGDISAVRR